MLTWNTHENVQEKAPAIVGNRGEASTEAPFDKSLNGRFPEVANDAEFLDPTRLSTLYAKAAFGGYSVEREEYGPPRTMWFRVRRSDGVVSIHSLERLEALAERCEKRSADRLLRNLSGAHSARAEQVARMESQQGLI